MIEPKVQLEMMLDAGATANGVEKTPENMRFILEYVIGEIQKDIEGSSSFTEKALYRWFLLEAQLMYDQLP